MKKLEKLNKEQKELMLSTSKEWVDLFFNTKRINKKQFEKGIKWLYEEQLKIKMPKVLYCESWLEALITIEVLNYNVMNTVGNTVSNTVGNTVGNTVSNTVGNTVSNTVGNTVSNTVSNTVGNNVSEFFYKYSGYLDMGNNFGWVSFYDYFEKINILENTDFKKYKSLVRSGAFQVYEFENYVFAVQPPAKIITNDNSQMNSLEGKAFEWSDGYGFYYVNGLNLEEDLFLKLKNNEFTFEDFLKENNEEVKSAIISFIQQRDGEEGIYRFFKKYLKEVDTYINKKDKEYLKGTTQGMNIGVYTLFKGVINKIEIAYVRCYCPSTDRMFFLGVDPKHENAKDAIASLYRVPKILKDDIQSISRQGERYSTVFQEVINKKLKNNEFSLQELNDLVSLSGDEYFEKIKYEY